MNPSSFYRSDLWRAGLAASRALPEIVLHRFARILSLAYFYSNRHRREIVIENLLPPLQFDRAAASLKARDLFLQFGTKLADLWRYESGRAIPRLELPAAHFATLQSALHRKRGLLLLTPHLGNWEFGAPLLRERGLNLLVITQAEPQPHLTELRRQARDRWGIETVVIGANPFAFVEVIRRLEQGAIVALLVDRPPAPSAVEVKMFGHRFNASIAPAELARASGCALLPVFIPRHRDGYAVHMLPEVAYDRASIASRESRANLTQMIMKQFELPIRQHLDQWFHFVPLWRK